MNLAEHEHKLRELVEKLRQAAGDNLESVVLYGSAARDDFGHHSDLNVLCILKDMGSDELDKVSAVVAWWSMKLGQRPPLFMTAEELQSSADVFAIETLDLKAHHRVLYGRDVVAGVNVPMTLHRVQLEHELRTALLRLRQHYLLARDNEAELRAVLVKSASSITTLLRHAMVAAGHAASESKDDLLARAADAFGIDVSPIRAVLDLRCDRSPEANISALYAAYVQAVAALVSLLDQAVPTKRGSRPGEAGKERRQ